MRKIVKNIVTLALIATVGVSATAFAAGSKTNAYMTVSGGRTSPTAASATVQNKNGAKRYSYIKICSNSNCTTVLAHNEGSINPGGSVVTTTIKAGDCRQLYAKGIMKEKWSPDSAVVSTLIVKIS